MDVLLDRHRLRLRASFQNSSHALIFFLRVTVDVYALSVEYSQVENEAALLCLFDVVGQRFGFPFHHQSVEVGDDEGGEVAGILGLQSEGTVVLKRDGSHSQDDKSKTEGDAYGAHELER